MYFFNFLERSVLFHDGCCILNSSEVIIHEFFYQDMIVVVKTNIDITFANNRCVDLSLAEFMIYFHYNMIVVVKTNIDITFANNRCFDLSLVEFIIYFHYT